MFKNCDLLTTSTVTTKTANIQIIEILPEEPRVKRVVLDFEKSVRKAIPKLLPRVKLSGCGFHWSQAVWRKV